MSKPFITIGYFGVPGGTGGQTHLVDQTDKHALCGTHFHPKAEYQWCYPHWQSGTPECERCKKIQFSMYDAAASPTGVSTARPIKSVKAKRPVPVPMDPVKYGLLSRVKNYLEVGGFFNPEMMEHDKVRDLIIDLRDYLEKH